MRLSEIQKQLAARLETCELHGADLEVSSFAIDSRQVQSDELFVAIVGPNFDGHDFADAAPAAAVVVSRLLATDKPQLLVSDTRLALGALGGLWRQQFEGKVLALTGSNGKTSTKEMLGAILQQMGPTLATQGNLNNDFGVPLTLARLTPDYEFAVIEMGANHAGEIAYLTQMVDPDVGLVTNAGAAHLEGFGSLRGVAHAKGELFEHLPEEGIAIINAEDDYGPLWHELAGSREIRSFGLSMGNYIWVDPDSIQTDSARGVTQFSMFKILKNGSVKAIAIQLPRLGLHNVMNALAAATTACAVGAHLADIKAGLESVEVVAGRLQQLLGPNGSHLLDDSYNANPSSTKAGIDVLTAMPGQPWLVFGAMSEIGDDSEAVHAEVGAYAQTVGIQRLFACGDACQATVKAFGDGAQWFATQEALAEVLQRELTADVTVLVKGSRSSQMEKVIEHIQMHHADVNQAPQG